MSEARDTVMLGAHVPRELAVDIRNLAETNERPVSAEIRRALRRHLDAERDVAAIRGKAA